MEFGCRVYEVRVYGVRVYGLGPHGLQGLGHLTFIRV